MTFSSIPLGIWDAYPGLGYGLVVFESILGCWLLVGVDPLRSWLVTILLFVLFGFANTYSILQGQVKCDCLGPVQANPWWILGLDFSVIALLIFVRPTSDRCKSKSLAVMMSEFSIIIGPATVLALLGIISIYQYGSVEAGISRLRGDSLYIEGYVDFGTHKPGDRLHRSVKVTNLSTTPIRIIGGSSDCSCALTAGLPLLLPAGESRLVTINLKLPETQIGNLTRKLSWLTDCQNQRELTIKINCQVE